MDVWLAYDGRGPMGFFVQFSGPPVLLTSDVLLASGTDERNGAKVEVYLSPDEMRRLVAASAEPEVRNTKAADDKWKEQVMDLTGSLVEADKELRRRVIVLESRLRGLEDPGDASSMVQAIIDSQRRRLAEPGPWEPMFEKAAESAWRRIDDDAVSSIVDAPKPVDFTSVPELYREALQAIADGARDPVSVAWKALHDASWVEHARKANEPLGGAS